MLDDQSTQFSSQPWSFSNVAGIGVDEPPAQPVINEGQPRARNMNGTWKRLVQVAHDGFISVPSSDRPIGQSLLTREFTLQGSRPYAGLCTF